MLTCGSPFHSSAAPNSQKVAGFFNKFRRGRNEKESICSDNNLFDGECLFQTPAVVRIPVDATGIQPRLCKLQEYLSKNIRSAGTMVILGPVGVGKTTLLKALNNEYLSNGSNGKHNFHVVIFSPVPRGSNAVQGLQAVISRRLGLPWEEHESQQKMAIHISMALRKVRFFLLLDDFHDPKLDLGVVGIPRQNGSRVLITTRYESVCEQIFAGSKIPPFVVTPLDPEESWQLFRRCAGGRSSHPDISEAAKKIANECEGLALGLVTVGCAMATVMTGQEWMWNLQIIKILKSEMYSLTTMVEDQRSITESSISLSALLYFSYKMLSTEQLKYSLLYCALYPKNHPIKKEELICYWLGEGLLKEQGNIDRARSEGHELIAKLMALGMLKDGDTNNIVNNNDSNEVIMLHDMMHDVAIRVITKNQYVAQAGLELTKMPTVPRCDGMEKVSLMHNSIEALDQLPDFPHLKTLILKANFSLGNIKENLSLLKAPSSLTLLDLSHTRVKTIPREIGNLVSLRHLDLSFTKIKALPVEIGNLVNLVQLLLEGTSSLATIPGDVVTKLSKVLVLNLYASYGDWQVTSEDHQSLTENGEISNNNGTAASIQELEGLPQLGDLGITICNTIALQRFSSSSNKRLTKSIRRLFVNECQDLDTFHLSKSSYENVRHVTISDCAILKKLIIGGSNCEDHNGECNSKDSRLLHLEVLKLKALYQAQIIWKGVDKNHSECLPLLRELEISFCHELRNVSWVLQLGLLEIVKLNSCLMIEHLIEASGSIAEGKKLPRLRTLALRNLPRLKHIFNQPLSFPSLELVKVLRCPQLKSLPRRTEVGATPVHIQGEMEWWKALESNTTGTKEKHPSFWYFQAAKELHG